jgi:hypothetical protein
MARRERCGLRSLKKGGFWHRMAGGSLIYVASRQKVTPTMPKPSKQKAAGIDALRLAGFENGLCKETYPAPVSRAKATLRPT